MQQTTDENMLAIFAFLALLRSGRSAYHLMNANARLQDALARLGTLQQYAYDRRDTLLQGHVADLQADLGEARGSVLAETSRRTRREK